MKDKHTNQDKAVQDETPKAEATPEAKHPTKEQLSNENLGEVAGGSWKTADLF